jgi:hypothetical protein
VTHQFTPKQKLRINLGAAILVLVAVLVWLLFAPHHNAVSAARIESMINHGLPKEWHGVKITKVSVDIADSKMTMLLDIQIKEFLKTHNMSVQTTVVPDFKRSKHAELYFNFQDTHLLHQEDKNSSHSFAMLPETLGTERAVKVVFELFNHFPYRIDEDSGWGYVAYTSILDHGVHIEGDKMIIDFTLWRISAVVIGIVLVVGVLLAIMITCPEALLVLGI